jgi:hypothetical protein
MAYIGRPPEYGGYENQVLTADGSTTSFALNFAVGTESSLLVSVAGVFQQPGTAYTLSGGGANIVFSVAPANGATVFVIFLGFSLDAGNAVNTGSITSQTDLGTSPAGTDFFLVYDASATSLKKVAYSDVHSGVANMAANTVKVRDSASSGAPSDKAVATTEILIGDGTGFTAAALSGDVTMTNAGAVTIAANAVDSAEITAGSIDLAHMSVNSIDSDQYVDGSIDLAHMSVNSIDSDQYVDGSIDTAHIANDQVTLAKMAGLVRGKIIIGDASGDPAALTVGSSGQALVSDGTDISWGSAGASLSSAQEWTAQQNFNNTALSFDATQDWALTANQVATLTLTANTIFDAPSQMVDGAFYSLIIIQDGTGSRTASWNTVFKWAAATAPTLTTTASAKDIFVWRSDGTNMYEVGRQLNVS